MELQQITFRIHFIDISQTFTEIDKSMCLSALYVEWNQHIKKE